MCLDRFRIGPIERATQIIIKESLEGSWTFNFFIFRALLRAVFETLILNILNFLVLRVVKWIKNFNSNDA
jgi:hypothetical protein